MPNTVMCQKYVDYNKEFNDLVINRTEIPQSDLNIDDKVRSNLFPWNGQFSPQFIEVLLFHYAKKGYILVDPFVGSGTTLYEAARKGLSAYGTELNASAYFMAKISELIKLSSEERAEICRNLDKFILTLKSKDTILENITSAIKNSSEPYNNVLSTLLVLMDIFNNDISIELLNKKWQMLKGIIYEIPYSNAPIVVENGDARELHIPDNTADLLITSPPYINVFNYHQKYRRSVEALGYNVLTIAKGEFGSNRKNRGNRFLTIIQYCIDMALSIKEASRACKNGARMIYVVGRESTVLGYSFSNSELVYNIAVQLLGLNFMLLQERVFKNRFGKLIYEDILHFGNNDSSAKINEMHIIEGAKNIAGKMIRSKIGTAENKNEPLLYDALEKLYKVKESEHIYG